MGATAEAEARQVKSKIMNPHIARAAAKELAAELTKSLDSLRPETDFPPLTLGDIFMVGAMVVRALSRYWTNAKSSVLDETEEICRQIKLGKMGADQWEERLYDKFVSGEATPADARQLVQFLKHILTSPARQRQVVMTAIGESFPPVEPGQLRKIENHEFTELAEKAAEYRGAAQKLLVLRVAAPSKSVSEIIEFMATDFLAEATLIAQHVPTIEMVMNSDKEFAAFKTLRSRVQLLADAMAGDLFRLEPTYAHQVAEEGRRRAKRSRQEEPSGASS